MIKEVSNIAEIEEIIGQDTYTLAFIYDNWNDACEEITPEVEHLAALYEGVTFIKADAGVAGWVRQVGSIPSNPTFFLFRNGERVDAVLGPAKAPLHGLLATYAA